MTNDREELEAIKKMLPKKKEFPAYEEDKTGFGGARCSGANAMRNLCAEALEKRVASVGVVEEVIKEKSKGMLQNYPNIRTDIATALQEKFIILRREDKK